MLVYSRPHDDPSSNRATSTSTARSRRARTFRRPALPAADLAAAPGCSGTAAHPVAFLLVASPLDWCRAVGAGELLRLWAVRHIGVISRTRSDRLGPLISTGPFGWVRNPLYIGNLALWSGFTVSAGLVVAAAADRAPARRRVSRHRAMGGRSARSAPPAGVPMHGHCECRGGYRAGGVPRAFTRCTPHVAGSRGRKRPASADALRRDRCRLFRSGSSIRFELSAFSCQLQHSAFEGHTSKPSRPTYSEALGLEPRVSPVKHQIRFSLVAPCHSRTRRCYQGPSVRRRTFTTGRQGDGLCQRYQQATERYGRQASPSFMISLRVGPLPGGRIASGQPS